MCCQHSKGVQSLHGCPYELALRKPRFWNDVFSRSKSVFSRSNDVFTRTHVFGTIFEIAVASSLGNWVPTLTMSAKKQNMVYTWHALQMAWHWEQVLLCSYAEWFSHLELELIDLGLVLFYSFLCKWGNQRRADCGQRLRWWREWVGWCPCFFPGNAWTYRARDEGRASSFLVKCLDRFMK